MLFKMSHPLKSEEAMTCHGDAFGMFAEPKHGWAPRSATDPNEVTHGPNPWPLHGGVVIGGLVIDRA